MLVVSIYILDKYTDDYNRIELYDDEKISLVSSIQNINDISKTYTDFSQTFTVPASDKNNKIFRHWYENSLDNSFDTLVKSDAYIEIDTIFFRQGKIQLESCNIKDGRPTDYSITFIGALGSLKDKFAGLFLKDLDSTYYDLQYTGTVVKDKAIQTDESADIMFPLISSNRYWNYGDGGNDDISLETKPIVFTELFPAIRLSAVLDMIVRDTKWDINFTGSFLTDERFTSAYLYLKNADTFTPIKQKLKINYTTESATNETGFDMDLANDKLLINSIPSQIVVGSTTYNFTQRNGIARITPTTSGVEIILSVYKNGLPFLDFTRTSSAGVPTSFAGINILNVNASSDYYEFYVQTSVPLTFTSSFIAQADYQTLPSGFTISRIYTASGTSQTMPTYFLPIYAYFPEIKIEDFFSGLLKMFNLTCYSTDGINYSIEQLESYYADGDTLEITKYIQSDNENLNRVKSYKKINFEYQKSESLVNVAFNSLNGVEYGWLLYNTNNDGDEYTIKLPFEDLNFNNLQDLLQVGYCLKTDFQKYIPKPIILYDYNPYDTTYLTGIVYYFNNGIATSPQNTYKAFGQEFNNGSNTFSLNFNEQQSTLTNELITKGLYDQYYSAYFSNIFNFKARLIKVSAILPTSLLTSLKLNDSLIIKGKKYIINTYTTDLTTGEVQFELLTDTRL